MAAGRQHISVHGAAAAVAAAVLALAPPVLAQHTEQAHMDLPVNTIVGVALWPDGKSPLHNLPVRVWNTEKNRMIYRTRTDNNGVFRIPKTPVARCWVFVGKVKVDLRILKTEEGTSSQQHALVVVVPRHMLLASKPEMTDLVIAPLLLNAIPPPRVVSP
jgi:hypothetical protein